MVEEDDLSQLLPFLVFVAPSVLLLVLAGRDIRKAVRMRRWPRVDGFVRDVRTRRGTRNTTKVDVRMAYTYEGRELVSWCVSPTKAGYSNKGFADADAIRNRVNVLQPGSTRPVIVNPDNPAEAYITMPETTLIAGMIMASLVLMLMALSTLVTLPG